MCKFCSTEPLGITDIAKHETKLVVDGEVCGNETLEVGYYVFDNDRPEHHIVASYTINNTIQKAQVEIRIEYCPFCGRKLHNN